MYEQTLKSAGKKKPKRPDSAPAIYGTRNSRIPKTDQRQIAPKKSFFLGLALNRVRRVSASTKTRKAGQTANERSSRWTRCGACSGGKQLCNHRRFCVVPEKIGKLGSFGSRVMFLCDGG